MTEDTDSAITASVAIIGGGPIGLVSFIALRRAGVDVVLAERHPTTAPVPKALLLNERTIEIMRQLGLEKDVEAVSLPRDTFGYSYRGSSLSATEYQRSPFVYVSDKTAVHSQLCGQHAVETVLLRHAEQLGPGRVWFGTRVDTFGPVQDGVELQLTELETQRHFKVRSSYVIAADGSRSPARASLGIGMLGEPSLGNSVHVIFDAPIGELMRGRESAMTYTPKGPHTLGPVLLVAVDGDRQWRLMFDYDPADAEALSEDALLETIRNVAGVDDLEITIRGIYPWEPAALCSERFRAGRVILAGDAAHIRPPWGGLGMNAGIGDAHNLAWKLAYVVHGWAGEDLLESYEQERQPVALRTISSATANRAHVQRDSHTAESQAILDRRQRAEGLVLGQTYESSAVIPDGTAPPAVEDPHADYVPTARPGHRAPHLWVRSTDSTLSLTDLFGKSFVLLCGPDGAAWRDAALTVAEQTDCPLKAYVVGGDNADLSTDLSQWRALYTGDAGAVLVRPDGHVAWREHALPAHPTTVLTDIVTRILARPPEAETAHADISEAT